MTALVVQANSRTLPLPDNSVDLVVTSPPYFALRSYTDGGKHYAGQVGDEPTPQEFLDSLLVVTAECVRVLKPTGSLWVNLGDKYAAHQTGHKPGTALHSKDGRATAYARGAGQWKHETIRAKSLIGLPWRYALRCIDDLGLILRAEVIWSKPNGLPESVTDRVRRSHEQWFHFTLEPRYFSAVDEIREAYSERVQERQKYAGRDVVTGTYSAGAGRNDGPSQAGVLGFNRDGGNALGKLPGSVWTVPTQPLKVPAHLGVDHFAAFPMEWPRRIIKGWSPAGICVECGEGRRPVVQVEPDSRKPYATVGLDRNTPQGGKQSTLPKVLREDGKGGDLARNERTITGYACGCPEPTAPTRPAVVLDPFGGTGTTALVASALGRTGISVDLSHDYSRLARWRTTDPGQRAAAMQVDKPEPVMAGQADLFGEL